jgi:TRAP transporter solute receptor, dctP family
MKMKTMTALIVFMIVSVGTLFAMGQQEGKTGATSDKIVLQVGAEANPGEPQVKGMERWAELVRQKSNGTMQLQVFPSSQLGYKAALIDQMLMGDPVISVCDAAYYADRGAPDLGIVMAPFLLQSWDDVWTIVKSDWYAEQMKILERRGLHVISSNWIYGERNLLTTKPVTKPQDIIGMKIRVPNNVLQLKGFEALRAVPTPTDLSEVYTSLQQKVVEGVENPLTVLYNGRFYEVAKYLAMTSHIKNFSTFVMSTKVYNSLSAEQQKILTEACYEAGEYQNSFFSDKADEEFLRKFKDAGVTVTKVNQSEFAKAAQGFFSMPGVVGKWTPGLYDRVLKIIENGRKNN